MPGIITVFSLIFIVTATLTPPTIAIVLNHKR